MSQSFSVNGKKYVSSSTLAASSGYTSDYIGRLAREEKILGSLVGRQWFIEPESLNVFICQTKFEKELRKEALRTERKLTQQVQASKKMKVGIPSMQVLSALQTMAVLFCGLLIGGLGWVTVDEKISAHEIAYGTEKSAQLVAGSVVLAKNIFIRGVDPDSSAAASTEGVLTRSFHVESTNEIYAVLPLFPPRGESASSTNATSSSLAESLQFSDEVRIAVDDLGNQFIEPVFRQTATNTSVARFLLVPANSGEN